MSPDLARRVLGPRRHRPPWAAHQPCLSERPWLSRTRKPPKAVLWQNRDPVSPNMFLQFNFKDVLTGTADRGTGRPRRQKVAYLSVYGQMRPRGRRVGEPSADGAEAGCPPRTWGLGRPSAVSAQGPRTGSQKSDPESPASRQLHTNPHGEKRSGEANSQTKSITRRNPPPAFGHKRQNQITGGIIPNEMGRNGATRKEL